MSAPVFTYRAKHFGIAFVYRHGEAGQVSKPLDPRLDLANHSPTGLAWGYGGSGPAQFALAILAHHFREFGGHTKEDADRLAISFHQQFKAAAIATREQGRPFELSTVEVEAAIERILQSQRPHFASDQTGFVDEAIADINARKSGKAPYRT